jgi:flavodoxin
LRACVVFDSRFGNTEKIARSLESGIEEAGIQTECLSSKDVKVESLKDCDLICVGAPTEAFSASKPIKDFLGRLNGVDLSGKCGFAFDTRLDSRFSGSAAKLIEKDMRSLNVRIIAPRDSAIVFSSKGFDGNRGATLKEGEEQRFQELGRKVGAALVASLKLAPA